MLLLHCYSTHVCGLGGNNMHWSTDEFCPRDATENSCGTRGKGVAKETGIPGQSTAQNSRVPQNIQHNRPLCLLWHQLGIISPGEPQKYGVGGNPDVWSRGGGLLWVLLASQSLDSIFPQLPSQLSFCSDSVRGVSFPPHLSVSSQEAITE